MNILPNGIGETVGDNLVLCRPLQLSGNIWYVCSIGGLDAAAPAGKEKERPLATLLQAITNAADDDVIVLLTGHFEFALNNVAIAKRLTIVGAGSSGGVPSVNLLHQGAATPMLAVTAANVEFRNITFSGQTGGAQISVAASATMFRATGCYFECWPADTAGAIALAAGADQVRLVNDTFISTAIGSVSRPMDAVKIAAGAVSNLELYGCVFSDGPFGFSAAAFNATQNVTKLKAEGLSLLRGALFQLTAGSTGYANVQTATGNGRVSW